MRNDRSVFLLSSYLPKFSTLEGVVEGRSEGKAVLRLLGELALGHCHHCSKPRGRLIVDSAFSARFAHSRDKQVSRRDFLAISRKKSSHFINKTK
jgi:hypothetical protein